MTETDHSIKHNSPFSPMKLTANLGNINNVQTVLSKQVSTQSKTQLKGKHKRALQKKKELNKGKQNHTLPDILVWALQIGQKHQAQQKKVLRLKHDCSFALHHY